MTNPNKMAIAMVIDRSGSITSIRDDMQGAVDSFIDEQRNAEGETTITIVLFNHQSDVVYLDAPIAEVSNVAIVPAGSTALNDTVARTIQELGIRLADLPEDERPGKVLFVIVTDGYENASREFAGYGGDEQIRKMVAEQTESWNWQFIFLGVGIDGFTSSQKYGIGRHETVSVASTSRGARAGGQSISSYAASYRSTGKGDFGLDDNDQRDQTS